jgi:hypothetical protein
MVRINGDLLPGASGFANLGVNVGPNAQNAFDITTLAPFNHVHQVSGVFHDPLLGQSGVLRFNHEQGAFQVSVDGGATFLNLSAGAGVDSVGVLGDTNLTGNVDFASPASGFIVIEDSSDASPLLWSVDTLGLSGLWNFPALGFDSVPHCYAETFTAATTWTATHNLGTTDVVVEVFDDNSPRRVLFPDRIQATDANTVTVQFNVAQAGRVVIIGCGA